MSCKTLLSIYINMKLSIIIPTYNEEKYLPKLLKSIKQQELEFDYEIIVSDNNSTDKTTNIAKEYWAIITSWWLPAQWRNNWARIAKWKWLFFLDADVVFKDSTSLNNYITKLEEYEEFVVWTPFPYSLKEERSILNDFFYSLTFVNQIFLRSTWGGYAIIIKKKVFNLMNWFNEELYLSEDHDLIRRARMYWIHKKLLPCILVSNRRLEKDWYLKTMMNYTIWSLLYFMWKKFKKEKYQKIYRFWYK